MQEKEEGRFMVFSATFNNISAISCRLTLLMEETRVLGENHRYVTSLPSLYPLILYIARFYTFCPFSCPSSPFLDTVVVVIVWCLD
jgi:hypothetical protein